MAPWTVKGHTGSRDQELPSLLSEKEQAELPVLLARIANVMRKRITDPFDNGLSSTAPSQEEVLAKTRPNTFGIKSQTETHEEEKARKFWETRQKDLSEPKQNELKNAALEYLQKWQDSIITRVEEVLHSKETAKAPTEQIKIGESATPDIPPPPDNKIITTDMNVEDSDAALIELYPPTSTSLYSLPKENRVVLLHAMLLLLLSLEHYVAYSRILLLNLSSSLHLPLHTLAEIEVQVAQGLVEAAHHSHMSGDEETKHRSEENKNSRRWKVGLAGVAGAALIGVTGGLAAPLVAAGIGSVMGGIGLGATATAGLLGTLAESSVVIGAMFGAYGGHMTGKMMDEYAKEVRDFTFLPLRGAKKVLRSAKEIPPEDRRLRVTVGISGWLKQKEDVVTPWRVLGHQSEVYALRWELEALVKLGTSMETLVKSYAWSVAKKEIIARTIFASLMDALWPIALLKVSKVVDNPFSVAKNMADKAGLVLADALINKAQGERPVTLIGYSLGARLIYSCLLSLAERRAFGLVESVVLMGTPAPSDGKIWRTMRSVVCGRLVNVYSEHDLILAFLYRTSAIQFGIAGIQEVEGVKAVENVDVSKLVSGHLRYQYLVGSILQKIGWEDIDVEEVAEEEETLALLEQDEAKEHGQTGASDETREEDVAALEKQANEKAEKSIMEHLTEKLHFK